MKYLIFLGLCIGFLINCSGTKNSIPKETAAITSKTSDTIRIANDSLEYEVIIIDGGFPSWLNSQAKPRGYYTENYLESHNKLYVAEWNNRVLQPQRFNPNLYEMQINYSNTIHYGYEVNYLLYNYMTYFQITNKQQLTGFVPRP